MWTTYSQEDAHRFARYMCSTLALSWQLALNARDVGVCDLLPHNLSGK